MQINIELLAVSEETKTTKAGKPYIAFGFTYKNLLSGKVDQKNIAEFTAKELCATLKAAPSGSKWTIDTEKNGEYRNWINAKPYDQQGGATSGAATSAAKAGGTTSKGEWETREERAARQVLIVKQSSLSSAITTLKTEKHQPSKEDVIALAQVYTNWVLGLDIPKAAAQPVERSGFEDMEDDIPM